MTNRTLEEMIDNVFHNYLFGGRVYRIIWAQAVEKYGKNACVTAWHNITKYTLPPELA